MIAHTLLRADSTLHKALRARLNHELTDDEFVAAIRGACTEEEFLDAVASQIRAVPESMGSLVSLMHRLSRRGEIRPSLIRRLESSQSEYLPSSPVEGITIELAEAAGGGHPVGVEPVATYVEIGTVLRDRYTIEQCLGRGGKGSVFKALDQYRCELPPSQQYVAVKVLHQKADSGTGTLDALRRELRCSQALSHPNVIKVFDLDRDGGLDFLTMEFLEGELLSALLARYRAAPMLRSHAWSIIRQVAAGVQHAHERGIVHADIKPQNIFITNSGEVRILDFGASCALPKNAEGDSGRAASVSPAYASCELLEGRAPDPRDDLYALACVAYELLTGTHPFQRRRASEAKKMRLAPARPGNLSGRQWNALAKGLSWDRSTRSASVKEWLEALKPETKESPSLRDMQPSAGMPAPTQGMSYLRVFAATLLLFAGVAWLLFARVSPSGGSDSQTVSAPPLESAPESSSNESSEAALPSLAEAERPKAEDVTSLASSRVPGRPHFAEIRVRRPVGVRENAPFVWWTEGASAKPGIDFINQPKATQFFPAGKTSTSVFVKLLPQSSTKSSVFYVAIAEGGDSNLQHVTHTAVRLPPI